MINILVRITVAALLLSSCSTQIAPVLTRPPLVEPLPLAVGVYFSPEFRAYRSKCDTWLWYDIGSPSVALFELSLGGLFRTVIVLDSLLPPQPSQKIHGIIVPAITYVHALECRELTYHLSLYSAAGKELGAWDVRGSTSTGPIFVNEKVRLTMRDAAANFVRGFRQQPAVKNWLTQAGIASPERLPQALPKIERGAMP